MTGFSKAAQVGKKKSKASTRAAYQRALERDTDPEGVSWCCWCAQPILPTEVALHHVIPRGRGGPTEVDNLATVHREMSTANCHRLIHNQGTPGWASFVLNRQEHL